MTYTSHGHHIPGSDRSDELGQVERKRCGGVPICTVCQKDVARFIAPDTPEPEIEAHFADWSDYEDPDRFMKHAKLFVVGTYNNTMPDDDVQISIDDLQIVWFNKTGDDYRAQIKTTNPGDGFYFDVVHLAEKEETTVETYLRIAHDVFSQEGND